MRKNILLQPGTPLIKQHVGPWEKSVRANQLLPMKGEKTHPFPPPLPSKKKSWAEKLSQDKDLPKVVTLDAAGAARWGGKTMAIAAPREVDALMRRVPRGSLTTINDLRSVIARTHRAEIGCPITTGIFSWMAANAAVELAASGVKKITPYWRTLKLKGELNPKYPGGIPDLTARLEAEGHHVIQKGKRYFVRDFEKSLAEL